MTGPEAGAPVAHLNYNHLYYFWVVARKGSIARASEALFLTPQTISGQLRTLEEMLDTKLFRKHGRGLVLTDSGALLFQYADEMFRVGVELESVLKGKSPHRGSLLRVGVADAVPKLIAYRLLEPALALADPPQLVCHEGVLEDLLGELAIHRLDVVIADSPLQASLNVRAYSHLLGECGVSFFAAPPLARRLGRRFPAALDGAPLLVPSGHSLLRRALDDWLAAEGLRPRIVAEFQDSALLKTFGRAGHGVFAVPSAIEREVKREHAVVVLGRTERIRARFYAISAERRIKHPAVLAISDAGRGDVFRSS
jgi:LysR family transcriptional regulator, transcriptional activator of nhaA